MLRYLPIFLFTVLSLTAAPAKTPVDLSFTNDGREWVKVRDEELDGQGLVEYMLPGQDKTNWTEVVTLQYFWSEDLDPKQLFELLMHDIEGKVGAKNVTKKILKEVPKKDLFGEWWIKDSTNDQHELIRIMSNGKVIGIIRYTTKAGDVPEKNINKWRTIIESATLNQ